MKIRDQYKIYLSLLFTIGLFSACNTTKNVADLNTNTDGLYRYDSLNPMDTNTIANLSVDEFFTDDKLLSLIHQGLENNYNIKTAIERIGQANASLVMAKAAKWPTVGAALQDEFIPYSSGADGTKVFGYQTNDLALGFTASWEIDIWGKLKENKKAQVAVWMNSQEALELVKTNLIATIAKGYFNLLSLDEQLKITKETIDLMEESTETIKALKDAGMQNAAAVEQSNAQLYNTQRSVFDIETAIRQQENALCILVGVRPGIVERNSLDAIPAAQKLEYGIPAQLLANRPDVRSAELAYRQAFHLTNVAQKNFYPTIQLSSGFGGFSGTDFSDLIQPASIAADLVGGITMPLYSQRRLKGNLAIAKSQQREAALSFEETLLEAGQEVSDILYGFDASLQKSEWRLKQIQSLTKAVDYNQDLLQAGEANYIEVLTAQQSLLTAKLSNVSEKLEQLTYNVELYKALGGGSN